MASSCDADTPGGGVAAAVPVVLPKSLRHGVTGGDEPFMESLAESILVMKKQREQLKMTKEDLSRKLKNARQRYTRLKKKALRLASGDLVDEFNTGSDATGMSVDSEPTAAAAGEVRR